MLALFTHNRSVAAALSVNKAFSKQPFALSWLTKRARVTSDMSGFDSFETGSLIQRITAEIERLSEEQNSAMHLAAVIGMTEQQASEYRQRGAKITELVKQIGMLQLREVSNRGGHRA